MGFPTLLIWDEVWRLHPQRDVRCVVVTRLSSKESFEVLPSIYLDKDMSSLRDGGAH